MIPRRTAGNYGSRHQRRAYGKGGVNRTEQERKCKANSKQRAKLKAHNKRQRRMNKQHGRRAA